MEKLSTAMQRVGEHLRNDPTADEKVMASWDIIRNNVTEMLGRMIELNSIVSDYKEKMGEGHS